MALYSHVMADGLAAAGSIYFVLYLAMTLYSYGSIQLWPYIVMADELPAAGSI